ncbi:hypothetical protein VOLCADRAFT_99898 [Volvox carteri f. nagariensis]|uniref:Uncharacterized protein n=1 Tax=Volvox carteri f. nagariensis TaxID=3068 RepID=D8UIX6_VOLCA|nr:uncharacterized protein VOLCADRAFT_99898 [Volvox carteri f. nagariensis]EFJ40331.1 hypothetical protein VOLCADRAFT_99898 [Volvox carteri f. nagariensis]|eukprot:XP_002958594.1 hypothetical protein VOLCADRAFT_99898 [Volvox carteri f. nagariensis]
MGNKLPTLSKAKARAVSKGNVSGASLLGQQPGTGIDDSTLEAELRAAHENALKLTAGVDLLADELRLEQQLAALDGEPLDDENNGGVAGQDDDLDLDALDPEELAELEGELQGPTGLSARRRAGLKPRRNTPPLSPYIQYSGPPASAAQAMSPNTRSPLPGGAAPGARSVSDAVYRWGVVVVLRVLRA